MKNNIHYIKSQNIIPDLLEYCSKQGFSQLYLLADQNTYNVLGRSIEDALLSAGFDIKAILLSGPEIRTDEHYIVQAMVAMGPEPRVFLAVGSGTITDIARFISHRAGSQFISIPTAPSVDGYTSTVAPMVVDNYKAPIPAHPPIAVFANLPTLCEAPKKLIAAGVGDLVGKYTSLVDWKLGHLLYNEPYQASVYKIMKESVDQAVKVIDQIAESTPEGITQLIDGLIGSGFGMLEFGDSRPASGSEHHIAHYWEMQAILKNRPAVLHGTEVGIATILSANRYERLRQITKSDARKRLLGKKIPDHNQIQLEIEKGYGPVSKKILQLQQPLFSMTQADLDQLIALILDHWDDIQSLAQEVPTAYQFRSWIRRAGGPIESSEIRLSPVETANGLQYGHYLRDRFTMNRLAYWLAIP